MIREWINIDKNAIEISEYDMTGWWEYLGLFFIWLNEINDCSVI